MNDTGVRQQLARMLWPGNARHSVWAVVDAARDPAVYRALLASRLEFRCLYSGRLPQALEQAAPQLVELLPNNPLTEQMLGPAWGCSWGVFVTTAEPDNLRHHLRKFLKVRDPAGRSLLFRYYDPRVLRIYLPSCRSDELAQLFGPIASFVVEGDRGSSVTEFRFDGRQLLPQTQALAAVQA